MVERARIVENGRMSNEGTVHANEQTHSQAKSGAERLSQESVIRLLAHPSLLAHLADIVSILDRELHFVYVSRSVEGRSASELLGSCFLDSVPHGFRQPVRHAFEDAWRSMSPRTVESPIGHEWCETRLVPITGEHGMPLMFLTSSVISERKRREQELSERESRLRHGMEASGVGTWTWDRTSDVVAWDAPLCRIYGLDPERGPSKYEDYVGYLHPEDRPRIEGMIYKCLETGVYEDFEHRLIRPDGEVRHVFCRGVAVVDDAGCVVGMRGGILDITDRKRLEEQLRHVQKMEAIGQLAAGIAHNFNNLLSIVLPNAELCRAEAPPSIQRALGDIEHAASRATEMVRQLMLFARHEVSDAKSNIDLAELAERTVSICRATFDRRITIDFSAQDGLPPVLARAGEIEQVLLNICINARDALDESRTENPRIEVSVERAGVGALRVSVRDNGPGINAAHQARVFEPFFTTKDVGRGTGLGLASAYGIVADHQGSIRCDSAPGAGTQFSVELPTTQQVSASVPPVAATEERGSETILLVDDEPLVRRALSALLEQSGFRVIEAEDGHDGLALVSRPEPKIDLILLDRSMPRMSGEQFLPRLREIHPAMPVILLTGMPGAELEVEGLLSVMLKPPRSAALLKNIRQLLDLAS
jgi:two-component system, cell cycle sensor histidine kinase and response regulator CckA